MDLFLFSGRGEREEQDGVNETRERIKRGPNKIEINNTLESQ